jgi:hypothetical protein
VPIRARRAATFLSKPSTARRSALAMRSCWPNSNLLSRNRRWSLASKRIGAQVGRSRNASCSPSAPQINMGEVNYRIFRIHRGWMSYRYLVDPTHSPPSVQNRASSDSRRKDLRGVGLLRSTMADSRVSRVLRSGRSLLHNAAPD